MGNADVIKETVLALIECNRVDAETRKTRSMTREARKAAILRCAEYIHRVRLIPEQMVSEELQRVIPKKALSRRYLLLLTPDKYKNPNKRPSDEALIKRSVKRVNSELMPEENKAMRLAHVVIIPKQKVQSILEASFHCKNNVVIIVSKDNRRPIAVYPDTRADQYSIRVEELLTD